MAEKIKIGVFLLSILFLISFVSAQYMWSSYGNDFFPLWDEQYTGSTGMFHEGWNTTSVAQGYSPRGVYAREQVLLSIFNGSQPYIVAPNTNVVRVYSGDMQVILDEIVTGGNIDGQIDINDFDNDGISSDVSGIFKVGSQYIFQSFSYDTSIDDFTFTGSVNLTGGYDYIQGIRGGGHELYAVVGNSTLKTADFLIFSYVGGNVNLTTIPLPAWTSATIPSDFYSAPSFFDFDGDGETEFMIYTDKEVRIFERNGTTRALINDTGLTISDAKMFKGDTTSIWKVAVLYNSGSSAIVRAYKSTDGSLSWSRTLTMTAGSSSNIGGLAINSDYDGDLSRTDNEIYVTYIGYKSNVPVGWHYGYWILKGYNGAVLMSFLSPNNGGSSGSSINGVTIADMNNDGVKDFIVNFGVMAKFTIFDPVEGDYIINTGSSSTSFTCVPADANLDGFLEVVCADTSSMTQYYSTTTNQPPYVNSVFYSPALVVAVGETLSMTITATDPESNPILYNHKCSDEDSWATASYSNYRTCVYNSTGIKNNTISVTDMYSGETNYFSYPITATETGSTCDGDGICEPSQGETSASCPSDCPVSVPDDQNYTQSPYGGATIPTQLVNVDNEQEGLFPAIYYGTLSFLSATLVPMMTIIFTIFFVLIILTLGVIIKKIFIKAGSMR